MLPDTDMSRATACPHQQPGPPYIGPTGSVLLIALHPPMDEGSFSQMPKSPLHLDFWDGMRTVGNEDRNLRNSPIPLGCLLSRTVGLAGGLPRLASGLPLSFHQAQPHVFPFRFFKLWLCKLKVFILSFFPLSINTAKIEEFWKMIPSPQTQTSAANSVSVSNSLGLPQLHYTIAGWSQTNY